MSAEFKDKIMLYCFREVKCEQGFTTEIWNLLYNALGLLASICSNGLMFNKSEFRYGAAGSFLGT